jgi:acyl-CoA synthetase (AMP-forming)/AMP-acid ligase II
MLERNAARAPGQLALTLCGEAGREEPLTHADLWRIVQEAAAHLHEEGVRPGERVLLVLPTSVEFIQTFFGAILLGAVPVPFSLPFSLQKLEAYGTGLQAVTRSATPAVCVTVPRLRSVIAPLLSEVSPRLRTLAPGRRAGVAPPRTDHPVAMLQFTSGSTRSPRGVTLRHDNLLANIAAIHAALAPAPDERMYSWLPLYHDMGLIGTLLWPLYATMPLVLAPPQSFLKDPASWLHGISRHRATLTVAPNFAYAYSVKRVTDEQLKGVRLDSLRTALNGAEPIEYASLQQFEQRFAPHGLRPHVVRPVYGLAESTLAVAFSAPGPAVADELDADALEHRLRAEPAGPHSRRRCTVVSVGHALPTQEVRIANDQGHTLEERAVGEILVRGPSVMSGYFQHTPESPQDDVLRGGWLHTGDYGYMAGGRLYVAGRKKDVIIRRGVNLFPQDLEHLVEPLPGLRQGCVVAFGLRRDDEEEVVLVAETRVADAEARARLKQAIADKVSAGFLLRPIDICLVPPRTIPKTSSGKVQRQACKALYVQGRLVQPAPAGRARTLLRLGGALLAHLARRARHALSPSGPVHP